MIRAVVFDVGETLVDETEAFGRWADWLGVPRHTFSAVFGASLVRDREQYGVFEVFKPGFDYAEEARKRGEAGIVSGLTEGDLYPDVRPCLTELKDAGLWIGIAGNQPARAVGDLAALGLPADLIAASAEWGVAKPELEFFRRVACEAPCRPGEILYVGDRVENDIVPARRAGLRTALLRRGPWGYITGEAHGDGGPDVKLEGLGELAPWVAAVNAGERDPG